jgi:hypothetical protein
LSQADFVEEWNNSENPIIFLDSKSESKEELSNKKPGTFRIRFSDSNPGQFAVSYISENGRILFILIDVRNRDFRIPGPDNRPYIFNTLKDLLLSWPEVSLLSNGLTKYEYYGEKPTHFPADDGPD